MTWLWCAVRCLNWTIFVSRRANVFWKHFLIHLAVSLVIFTPSSNHLGTWWVEEIESSNRYRMLVEIKFERTTAQIWKTSVLPFFLIDWQSRDRFSSSYHSICWRNGVSLYGWRIGLCDIPHSFYSHWLWYQNNRTQTKELLRQWSKSVVKYSFQNIWISWLKSFVTLRNRS